MRKVSIYFATQEFFNTETPLTSNCNQNKSKTHHHYLYFLDIPTQEINDSEFYSKHPQQ